MARLTNKFNIPQQIVSAVIRDPYSRGGADISVTQLIQPPRIIQLKQRFEDQIEEDVSDRIWSLLGQTCHKILERADQTGALHEERITCPVDGWDLSGAVDCYVTKDLVIPENGGPSRYVDIPPAIRDYKFIKTMAGGFSHPDWEQQTNVNAWLWRENGFPVDRLEIVAIFRDWSKVMFERGGNDYPRAVMVYKQKLWSHEDAEDFIRARIMGHKLAAETPTDLLPFCSPDDQWRRAAKWAVMKGTVKKAKKLCKTEEEAIAVSQALGSKQHYIEFRPAVATRCEMFCDVRPFCNQYALEKGKDDAGSQKAA